MEQNKTVIWTGSAGLANDIFGEGYGVDWGYAIKGSQDIRVKGKLIKVGETITYKPLKVWSEYFDALVSGDKSFEVRKNDRNYQVGDILQLREWDKDKGEYTGRYASKVVTYMLNGGMFGIEQGYCVMGLN